MANDILKYIPSLIFASLIALVQSHQSCNKTFPCPEGYFCNFHNKSVVRSECMMCTKCSDYNKLSILDCATTTEECGTCINGYKLSKMNATFCEIDANHPILTNEQTTALTSTAAPTNINFDEFIVILAIWLPSSALVVVALTLVLSLLYKQRIRRISRKSSKYFDHVTLTEVVV